MNKRNPKSHMNKQTQRGKPSQKAPRNSKPQQPKIDLEKAILVTMMNHIGRNNSIGMAELFSLVYQRPWTNRVYDTRPIRKTITRMRAKGIPILSSTDAETGGYYLASVGSEKDNYCEKLTSQAVKKLQMVAKIKGVRLSGYLKQLAGSIC